MTLDVKPKSFLGAVLPQLGSVLQCLFEEGGKDKKEAIPCQTLLQKASSITCLPESTLVGALAILYGMGLIDVNERGEVKVTSRHANFALGSLGKFLNASIPAVDGPVGDIERDYLVGLTQALESLRMEKPQVNDAPLHSRKIVNVLIKSRQTRRWKAQDVYLHVYHPQWKQYHLVGLSHKDDSKKDQEIAAIALKRQVGLMPDQYSLDPVFNPPEMKIKRISATSGAFTEYIYRLMVVKEVKISLKLHQLIEEKKFDRDWFRWFTWEEIRQGESYQGEPIMFSTPIILEGVDLGTIPLSAPKADDVRATVRIGKELGYRFTFKQMLAVTSLLVVLVLIQFLPLILSWLGRPNIGLTNLAGIAQITALLIVLVEIVPTFLRWLRE
jgi:hypothetical protein